MVVKFNIWRAEAGRLSLGVILSQKKKVKIRNRCTSVNIFDKKLLR